MVKSVTTEVEASTLLGRSKTASMTGRAALAAVAIIVASCGGSSSDPDPSSSAADEAVVADSDVGDSNDDVAAVRAAIEENADEIGDVGDDALDCIAEEIAADADLAAQVLADADVDESVVAPIMVTCAPETFTSMLTDDPMFASLTDDEALCVIEAMADNPELLLSESDVAAMFEETYACAPTAVAGILAADTGLAEADAECVLSEIDDFGALIALGGMDPDLSEADAMAGLDELYEILDNCDIPLETLAE